MTFFTEYKPEKSLDNDFDDVPHKDEWEEETKNFRKELEYYDLPSLRLDEIASLHEKSWKSLLASQKKVLVGEERSAWLNGLRCVCCGEPKTKDNLSNTCDACWEKQ